MALNTEAKRWSMLQHASGPSAYPVVINPSGSDADSAVERFTVLKLYGGLAANASAAVTVGALTEADIVAGAQAIVIELTNDTWTAAVGGNNATTTALINGLDSDGAEATGWDAVVKAGLTFNDVARTSDTVVTITLPAFATYDITADETITATIPHTALQTTSGTDVEAAPTFDVSAIVIGGRRGGGGGTKRKRRRYPRLVLINGRRVRVNNAAEERALLAAYRAELEEERQAVSADAPPSSPKIKRVRQKIKRVETRIDDAEANWQRFLDDDEEDLIALLLH